MANITLSEPSFSKSWPAAEEEQQAWVSEFLESELPELAGSTIKNLNAGFMGSAFLLEPPTTAEGAERRMVFQRTLYPKHRAFAFHRAAGKDAPQLMYTAYHPAYQSVSISAFAEQGPFMSYDIYTGAKAGEKPSVEMMEKCGRMLARLHKIDIGWHQDFASKEAAAAAGIPEVPEEVGPAGMFIFIYDPADKHPMEHYSSSLASLAPEEPLLAAGLDKNYIVAENHKVVTHAVLPQDGWTARTVSQHGDFHGSNIVVTGDGNPLAIDFESSCIGPAGWDLAHIYLHVRSLEPQHDYKRSCGLCKGYLSIMTGIEAPKKEDVEQLLFDVLAWQYVVGLKQWTCQVITEHFSGQKWAPEKKREALRLLKKENLEQYVATIQQARMNSDLRARLIMTGEVVPLGAS